MNKDEKVLSAGKRSRKILLLLMILAFLIGSIKLWKVQQIVPVDLKTYTPATEVDPYSYNLDLVYYQHDGKPYTKDLIDIEGWVIEHGVAAEPAPSRIRVILKDQETGAAYSLPTAAFARPELTGFFSDGTNYDDSGFKVGIRHGKTIHPDDRDYRIYLLVNFQGKERLIDTKTSLYTWKRTGS